MNVQLLPLEIQQLCYILSKYPRVFLYAKKKASFCSGMAIPMNLLENVILLILNTDPCIALSISLQGLVSEKV